MLRCWGLTLLLVCVGCSKESAQEPETGGVPSGISETETGEVFQDPVAPETVSFPEGITDETNVGTLVTLPQDSAWLPDRTCAPGTLSLVGESSCTPMSVQCSGEGWPEPTNGESPSWFVQEGATGDGQTIEQPAGSLFEVVALAEVSDVIWLAEGTYEDAIHIDRGLTIRGACAERTTLNGPPALQSTTDATIEFSGSGDAVLSGVTLGGDRQGIRVDQHIGTVTIHSVAIENAHYCGIYAKGSEVIVDISQTTVRHARVLETGIGGFGILALASAQVFLDQVELRENRQFGLRLSSGAQVEMNQVAVLDTAPNNEFNPSAAGHQGNGFIATSNAQLRGQRIWLGGNHEAGGWVDDGASVLLEDVIVRATQHRPLYASEFPGDFGSGFLVSEASLELERAILEQNSTTALWVEGGATSVTAQDIIIRDTVPILIDAPEYAGEHGNAVFVAYGAQLEMERAWIDNNKMLGIWVGAPGSKLTLKDALISNTQPSPLSAPENSGGDGSGLLVSYGAAAELERVWIDRSHYIGVFVDQPGSYVKASHLRVTHTQPVPIEAAENGGLFGVGITVKESSFEGDHVLVDNNTTYGILAQGEGAEVTLTNLDVRETQVVPADAVGHAYGYGQGVVGSYGASLTLERASISGNTATGIWVQDLTTRLIARDVSITGTHAAPDEAQEDDAGFGDGIIIAYGAVGEVQRFVARGNERCGIIVADVDEDMPMHSGGYFQDGRIHENLIGVSMQIPIDELQEQFTNVQAYDNSVNFSSDALVVPAAMDAFGN